LRSKLDEHFRCTNRETMSVDRKSLKNGSVTGKDSEEPAYLDAHSSCNETYDIFLRDELKTEGPGDSAGHLRASRAGLLRDENNSHRNHRWFIQRFQ
jgi:hypothetical protein